MNKINIIHYKTIDSTQKEIWRKIENRDIKDKTLIMADIQTDGIGTHGRKWYTTEENNIAFSFVMYPHIEKNKLKRLLAVVIASAFLLPNGNFYSFAAETGQSQDNTAQGQQQEDWSMSVKIGSSLSVNEN